MPILKRIRVIKKIQEGGAWRFISLKRAGKRLSGIRALGYPEA